MRYEDVNEKLLSEFPEFLIDEDDEEYLELPYIVAGWFTAYILKAYESGDKDTYIKGLQFIEKLHEDETEMVRELATIGYLESIQNTWPQDLIASDIPFNDLGELSKKWWIKLNDFWNGKMDALSEDE